MVYYKPNQIVKNITYKILETGKQDVELERPPLYFGGQEYFLSQLVQHIQYPALAMQNGATGTVKVVFTVNKDGIATGFQVKEPIGFGLDEEAVRVFNLIENSWLPGLVNGQAVATEVVYPVDFMIR